ncbi:Aste57867_21244 [Aphanomyces stellatus]|uniref:Aste57867_21244 protein n=1 Tax=Aphanomyces stellatus TaxID=120398 RepID=A0A485LIG1_9STRA|nr:hypothetical protein As57867_021175 [Aphanomyces stellatus]VFT97916.1 Aste57867_21244 [Aphanomyces stellatus]
MAVRALGRWFAPLFVILATAEAHNDCPYADLPSEVTRVRVWDDEFCSPELLVNEYTQCIIDKTACKQIPYATTYQAVGDISGYMAS